jgi:hypothetical protein
MRLVLFKAYCATIKPYFTAGERSGRTPETDELGRHHFGIFSTDVIAAWMKVPSGGPTLIEITQKWGFSGKVLRRPPADIFLNESSPPKTPCGHHVHGRHGHGSPVKNL